MKKYIVYPGYVSSKKDGDKHFIGTRKLMKLYRVKIEECFIYNKNLKGLNETDFMGLYPRGSGNYEKKETNSSFFI